MIHDRILTVLPRLSTEWIVSFTIRFVSLSPSSVYCSIFHMTQGGDKDIYGIRTPSLFLNPGRNKFHINSAVNGIVSYTFNTEQGLIVDVPTQIEIHQRYISGGKYRYFIKINGEEVHSIINNDARQFYNVKVYASNSLQPACSGYIKNLAVTNFL